MTGVHNLFPRMTQVEAENKLAEWKRSYAGQAFNGNVYHYTSLAALGGILSTRSIFCSDYRHLNDTTELAAGIEVLEAAIAARAEAAGISAADIENALDHLALLQRARFHISMFTASFSIRGNDLTQWRAYAPRNGVSIGFREPVLKRIAEEQSFACGAVRYLGAPLFSEWLDAQLASMKDGLVEIARNEAVLRERAAGDPQEHVDMLVQFQRNGNLERWIGEVAGFLKNADFRSEQEWRCVFVIRDNTIQHQIPVYSREAGSRPMRFVELDMSTVDLNELVAEVIIGPGESEETFHLAADLLRSSSVTASIRVPFHALR
ncbi:MAG: DUF2971 domain-containing protein [Hyphomicrobium sp.]